MRGIGRFTGRRSTMQSPNEALQPLRPPPPPQRQKRRARRPMLSVASGILSFALVVGVVALAGAGYGRRMFAAPGPLPSDKIVFITRGTSASDIVDKLEQQGVIDSSFVFSGGLYLYHKWREIRAGEYLFKAHVSNYDVMTTLVDGKSIQHSVTLPEGLTSEQIVERLKDVKDDTGAPLLSGDVSIPHEGTLMPDTVKFTRGDSRESIIKYLQAEQRRVLSEIWQHRAPDLPLKSPAELVTLASIVEKETGKADERARVAGVFVNRLMKGMKLQSDPTIIYGLVGGKGTLGRPITSAEVREATPYNTYAIPGLPPGPICNPGRAALEAAANPLRTKELYFVADGTGGHAFAETWEDHLKNVARWRQVAHDAKDKAPPETEKPAAAGKPQRTEIEGPQPPTRSAAVDSEPTGTIPVVQAAPPAKPSDDKPAPPSPAAKSTDADHNNGSIMFVGNYKLNVGPAIDQMGWRMPGTELGEEATLAELNADDDNSAAVSRGSLASYPVSAAMLADIRAREARFGLDSSSSTTLPPDVFSGPGTASADAPPCRTADAGAPFKPRAFDASEGTALDPLRNKTYDLNSPKAVPSVPVLVASLGSTDGLGALARKPPARSDVRCTRQPAPPAAARLQLASAQTTSDASRGFAPDGKPRAFDASEGTRLDPLRNTTYDLNSPQAVPSKPLVFTDPLQGLPPLPPLPPSRTRQVAVAQPPASVAAGVAPRGGFDASEGTALDPLRNKTYDLTSPQTVPSKTIALTDPPALHRPLAPPAAKSAPVAPDVVIASLPPSPAADPAPAAKPIIHDAAERKRLDAQLDKTFDLGSPHTVPSAARLEVSAEPPAKADAVETASSPPSAVRQRAVAVPGMPVAAEALGRPSAANAAPKFTLRAESVKSLPAPMPAAVASVERPAMPAPAKPAVAVSAAAPAELAPARQPPRPVAAVPPGARDAAVMAALPDPAPDAEPAPRPAAETMAKPKVPVAPPAQAAAASPAETSATAKVVPPSAEQTAKPEAPPGEIASLPAAPAAATEALRPAPAPALPDARDSAPPPFVIEPPHSSASSPAAQPTVAAAVPLGRPAAGHPEEGKTKPRRVSRRSRDTETNFDKSFDLNSAKVIPDL